MGGAGYQAGGAVDRPCETLADIREGARQLMRANEPSPDPNTSVIVASASLVALLAQRRLGVGQSVHVDMLCANAHANADAFLRYRGMEERPAIDESHFGTGALNRLYPTADGWVFLAVTTEREWERLRSTTPSDSPGAEVIATHRFRTDAPSDARLADALTVMFATRPSEEWERDLCGVNVGCVRADRSTPGVFYATHEQMRVNGFVPVAAHARFGEMRRWGPIVSVLDSDGNLTFTARPGVLAGEHTDALLAELGHPTTEIERLRAARVVASEPVRL